MCGNSAGELIMNILQVNKFYYPKVGGIERVVQNIAEGLPKQYNTHVLAAQPVGFPSSDYHSGVKITKAASLGVIMSVPVAPTFPIRFQSAVRDADVVHHHLPNPLSAVSQLMTKTDSPPIVATYHSDIIRQVTAFKLYRPILHRFLRTVDRILVTSRRLLKHSNVLQPHKDKCDVVPLSIDLTSVGCENPAPLNTAPEGPIVLFVGRLNYYKGVEYLVKAMRDVDATLLVAGDGNRRSALQELAQDRGVSNKIQFLGYLSEERLAAAYRAADVFVLPSVEPSEAFGIVQLEAMARGTPVVNTALPTGVPWVSQDDVTGLTVPPRNPAALADAINTLLTDDERRRKYAERARARVGEMFTRDQMIDRITTVYESLS